MLTTKQRTARTIPKTNIPGTVSFMTKLVNPVFVSSRFIDSLRSIKISETRKPKVVVFKKKFLLYFSLYSITNILHRQIKIHILKIVKNVIKSKPFGAECGDRTRKTFRSGDFKSPAYTNSANPACGKLVSPLGFEPRTYGLKARCSTKLS